ncbi:MAG: PIN domain-containing protein [Thermus sp.]
MLYPASIRNLLVGLALKDLVRLRWSERVQEEWIANLLRNRPDLEEKRLRQLALQITGALESQEPLVVGYENFIPLIDLPDVNDRHVVAAAVAGKAEAILTFNLKDFPQSVLEAWDLVAYNPDEYLMELLGELIREKGVPHELLDVLKSQRAHLKNPPLGPDEFLNSLERSGLKALVQALRNFRNAL